MALSFGWICGKDYPSAAISVARNWISTAVATHGGTGFMYKEQRDNGEKVIYVHIANANIGWKGGWSKEAMYKSLKETDCMTLLRATRDLFQPSETFRWSANQKDFAASGEVIVSSHIVQCAQLATIPGQFRLYNLCKRCEFRFGDHGCVNTICLQTNLLDTIDRPLPVRTRSYKTRPAVAFGFTRSYGQRMETVKSFFITTALANGFHGFIYREWLNNYADEYKVYALLIGEDYGLFTKRSYMDGFLAEHEHIDRIYDKAKHELCMRSERFEWYINDNDQLRRCVDEAEVGTFKTYNACVRCVDGPPCTAGCVERSMRKIRARTYVVSQ